MTERNKKPGWKDVPRAGIILENGNAAKYLTGGWRTKRPIWEADRCINCLRCWIYCPDSAIQVEDGKMIGIDYDHCKGCGICANECPEKVQALKMVSEDEAKEEKAV